ncbi:DNA-binding protein [Mycobacteroides abscessus]|nr:DNA-binding protein [Mycobacteroides abscessus]RIS08455.1 DNA-binding protein [Mycobacteroides abscessus]
MKCARPNCSSHSQALSRSSFRQGLCKTHYRLAERGYVDSAPVQARLELLHAAGCSWAQIAKLAEMSDHGVRLIRDGEYDSVRKLNAQRILTIPIPGRFGGNGYVSAVGTARRLQALVAIGWSFDALAKMMGTHRNVLLTTLKRERVLARRAREIAELFTRLHLTPGPSERARRHASANRWPVPFAWDEDTIDDPSVAPDLGGKSTWMQEYEDYQWVHGDDKQIAEAMSIRLDSLKTQLRRKGQAA